MTLLYPELIGLGFNFTRRPKGSTSVQPHVSGREIRVGYWTYPLYEWDLTYEVLRDFERDPASYTDPSVIQSELKRLEGFFLAVQGSLTAFDFKDPDDNNVIGQTIATTDGIAASYLVVRTYGDVGYGAAVTETVGDIASINVYLNGVLQTYATDYSLTGGPVAWSITFASPPSAGQALTADIGYYFYVRFQKDTLDFEKFFNLYWMVKKITLVSLRG